MPHAVALYDNKTLRELETAASDALGDPSALMQRAGQAAWRHLLARWPQAQRIVVVCGPGNNGGDGYVLATHALQSGRDLQVVRLEKDVPRSEPAHRACHEFEAAGGRAVNFSGVLLQADVVVDALFGIGLSRAPEADSAALIEAINTQPGAVFALDVPSGIDADSGNAPGVAVGASCTLQLLAAHRGLVTGAALDHCGEIDTASLGIDASSFAGINASARALHADALIDWLKPRQRDSHKGNNGHVLCIGGDHGSGGAIALAAEAALRSGAGLTSVATRAGHVAALLTRRPEAMVRGVESAADLGVQLDRADVVAIGPGLGQHGWGASLYDRAMACAKPLVVDADALNLLSVRPRKLRADTILTPHPGEAARLLGITTKDVQADRFAAAYALVERFGCVVVLKGAGTIIAAPEHVPHVIAAGNPGMAVGGMGDVLTGVIAALRAQGFDAIDGACCGALLHAVAGDAAAHEGGERGLLPSDLFVHLRRLANPGAAR